MILIKTTNHKGFSLVELVIAMGIFTVLAGAVIYWMLGGFASIVRADEITTAQFLAQEAVESIHYYKKENWHNILFDKTAINTSNGEWSLTGEGTSGQIGRFTRFIEFSDVYRDNNKEIVDPAAPGSYLDVLTKQVDATVNWQASNGERSIILTTLISAWNSSVWEQDDWRGGGGQTIWQNEDQFEIEDGNVDYDLFLSLGQISTSTTATSGELISSAYFLGNGKTAFAIGWEESIPEECSNCDLLIMLKTAPDSSGLPGVWSSTWCGPDGEDGDEDDYYQISKPELISSDHEGDEWIKYKVILAGEGGMSPELDKITIYYE